MRYNLQARYRLLCVHPLKKPAFPGSPSQFD
jgi:hypothetical protein